jgi:hypothetical protein
LFLLYLIPQSIVPSTRSLQALNPVSQTSIRRTLKSLPGLFQYKIESSGAKAQVTLAVFIRLSFTTLCALAHIKKYLGNDRV